jgi:ATP-dependent DNA helicase RecG
VLDAEALDSMEKTKISADEVVRLLATTEGHFADVKAIDISPGKLTKALCAFANADGGELLVGIDENKRTRKKSWRGFEEPEDANGHIQAFEAVFPLGDGVSYTFLEGQDELGLVLRVEVKKAAVVRRATNGKAYVRRGAQNLPVDTDEALRQLERNKGITSFETETVATSIDCVTDSLQVTEFIVEVVPSTEAEPWLRKQQLIKGELPTVAAIVLFSDEPQAVLPKRCGIKVYRYTTRDEQGTRETLEFDPVSIEGSAYNQIYDAVNKTAEIIEAVRVKSPVACNASVTLARPSTRSSLTACFIATTQLLMTFMFGYSTTGSRYRAPECSLGTLLRRIF